MKLMWLLVFCAVDFAVCRANVVPNRIAVEAGAQPAQDNQGLYDVKDKVTLLSQQTGINEQVLEQKHASLVQFFNSFCGHCRRFAPTYKTLAKDIYSWREVIKVMAIDCALDENNDVCRDYEIMAYPSLRYFSPHYEPGTKKIGETIAGHTVEAIKTTLVNLLTNETNSDSSWPDFSSLTDSDMLNLFKNGPKEVQYVILVYEPENSTIAGEMILYFSRYRTVKIRRVTSPAIASEFHMDTYNMVAAVSEDFNVETLSIPQVDSSLFKRTIYTYLNSVGLDEESDDLHSQTKYPKVNLDSILTGNREVLAAVKQTPYKVYQADIDKTIRYTLSHEIPKRATITGDDLLALKKYLNFVVKFNPLNQEGQALLKDLDNFVLEHDQEIEGKALKDKFTELERDFPGAFEAGDWVGCIPSRHGLRSFPCGLWRTFHFMLARAADDDRSSDPLEGLQAIHGYVKHFFGCTDCSQHFQDMASRNKIWNTPSKDEAVLWLWSAHNEVNQRLSGDITEDPEFPKIQFPTKEWCDTCIDESQSSSVRTESIHWNKREVLRYLKLINSPDEIDRFGIPNVNQTAERSRAKRMIANVFNELDMRMGIFLYIFCIGMMIVAVKLFLKKGYRKKPYAHSFLGKV